MNKRDARKLSMDAQREVRRQSIRLILSGMTHQQAAMAMGVSRPNVTRWWGLYGKGGWRALRGRRRGRRQGQNRRLSPEQEQATRRWIRDTTPDQLKLPFALWTRRAVADLIEIRVGITLPVRTMGEYLKRWGFTPQKPLKRAYEQNPRAIRRWLREEYPAIAARARKEKAHIYWGDETGLSSEDHRGRGFSPKGQTPIVNVSATRFSISMISAITNKGSLRFMVYKGALRVPTFIEFLRRLKLDQPQKIFLIIDNLRVHHARRVRDWIARQTDQIELFYCPAIAPNTTPTNMCTRTPKPRFGTPRRLDPNNNCVDGFEDICSAFSGAETK
jgi:transposase